jgi:hypothetical protein
MYVVENGDHRWYANGRRHRTDGPALIRKDGTQVWFFNDTLHRTDGPARIFPNGDQEWWVNNKRHRLDGPAVIWADGRQEWLINDRNITREVKNWMRNQGVTWPWNEEIQAQFVLTFT